MGRWSILALAGILMSTPVLAQQGQQMSSGMPMMQQGTQQCMAMMGGPSPAMLLQHRDVLGLSADQVRRLEAIQDRAQTARPGMKPAMQAHMAAAELLESDAPDLKAYEARLREAADHMVRAHAAMARLNVEARGVLTAPQRAKLPALRSSMMGMMRGRAHVMAGMSDAGMGGMMMPCMMMTPDSTSEAHHHKH